MILLGVDNFPDTPMKTINQDWVLEYSRGFRVDKSIPFGSE